MTALDQIRRDYAARLPDRLDELERAVERALLDPAEVAAAAAIAHRVRGTAGSYGHSGIAEAVGVVEELLQTRRNDEGTRAQIMAALAAARGLVPTIAL
ncbi:MAG: Hpt domain-containing protein [Kofleriaceae bacterium]